MMRPSSCMGPLGGSRLLLYVLVIVVGMKQKATLMVSPPRAAREPT